MSPKFEEIWAKRHIPALNEDPSQFTWGTYIDNRSPQFKVHRIRAHARDAIEYKFDKVSKLAKTDMAIYEKVNGEWETRGEWYYGDPITTVPWLQPERTPEQIEKENRDIHWSLILDELDTFKYSLPDARQETFQAYIEVFKDAVEKMLDE